MGTKWNPLRVYHAKAGELRDGCNLIGKNGKPFKRGHPVVIIEARYFKQICRAWKATHKEAK